MIKCTMLKEYKRKPIEAPKGPAMVNIHTTSKKLNSRYLENKYV